MLFLRHTGTRRRFSVIDGQHEASYLSKSAGKENTIAAAADYYFYYYY